MFSLLILTLPTIFSNILLTFKVINRAYKFLSRDLPLNLMLRIHPQNRQIITIATIAVMGDMLLINCR